MNGTALRGAQRVRKKWTAPTGEVRVVAQDFNWRMLFGEHPEGAVQAQVLIDTLYRAGMLAAAVRSASGQPSLDEVFLDVVEDRPEAALAIVPARLGTNNRPSVTGAGLSGSSYLSARAERAKNVVLPGLPA